jgi:hypothetical protein
MFQALKTLAALVSVNADHFHGGILASDRILSNGCCLRATEFAHIVSFAPYG